MSASSRDIEPNSQNPLYPYQHQRGGLQTASPEFALHNFPT